MKADNLKQGRQPHESTIRPMAIANCDEYSFCHCGFEYRWIDLVTDKRATSPRFIAVVRDCCDRDVGDRRKIGLRSPELKTKTIPFGEGMAFKEFC